MKKLMPSKESGRYLGGGFPLMVKSHVSFLSGNVREGQGSSFSNSKPLISAL